MRPISEASSSMFVSFYTPCETGETFAPLCSWRCLKPLKNQEMALPETCKFFVFLRCLKFFCCGGLSETCKFCFLFFFVFVALSDVFSFLAFGRSFFAKTMGWRGL